MEHAEATPWQGDGSILLLLLSHPMRRLLQGGPDLSAPADSIGEDAIAEDAIREGQGNGGCSGEAGNGEGG